MTPVTFHKDVYLPDDIAIYVDRKFRNLSLRYGTHALNATVDDKYGVIKHYELPTTLRFLELIEAEVINGDVVKVVMRKIMQDGRRLIVVAQSNGFVRTLWSNQPNDDHATLDRSRYAQRKVDETPKQVR